MTKAIKHAGKYMKKEQDKVLNEPKLSIEDIYSFIDRSLVHYPTSELQWEISEDNVRKLRKIISKLFK